MSEAVPWQLKIYSKSLKKKEKMSLIQAWLPSQEGRRVLDLGCAKGTLSRLMRGMGGRWVHADLDQANLRETLELVDRGVVRVDAAELPFRAEGFDTVVSLDFIEHVRQDERVLRQILHLLRPGGTLLLSTPITGPGFVLNKLKRVLGLPPEVYGHVREGYGLEELVLLLEKVGFQVVRRRTYARFFTEMVELAINVAFRWLKRGRGKAAPRRDGDISPGSEGELKRHAKAFRLYAAIYPITYTISRLDRCIPFLSGYATLILARRPAAPPPRASA